MFTKNNNQELRTCCHNLRRQRSQVKLSEARACIGNLCNASLDPCIRGDDIALSPE